MPSSITVGEKYIIGDASSNLIGRGTFGSVFSGKNSNTGDTVAIKIEAVGDDTLLKHEAQIYAVLNGTPGVPPLRSYGTEGDYNYLVTDKLGASLGTLFDKHESSFSLTTTINLGIRMLRCIEGVHSKGIVHRDIKPDNFLMGHGPGSNNLYLIDFGLSKSFIDSSGNHEELQYDRKMLGTEKFASVAVLGGSTPSRRDDLESIGCILVYLFTGLLPPKEHRACLIFLVSLFYLWITVGIWISIPFRTTTICEICFSICTSFADLRASTHLTGTKQVVDANDLKMHWGLQCIRWKTRPQHRQMIANERTDVLNGSTIRLGTGF